MKFVVPVPRKQSNEEKRALIKKVYTILSKKQQAIVDFAYGFDWPDEMLDSMLCDLMPQLEKIRDLRIDKILE